MRRSMCWSSLTTKPRTSSKPTPSATCCRECYTKAIPLTGPRSLRRCFGARRLIGPPPSRGQQFKRDRPHCNFTPTEGRLLLLEVSAGIPGCRDVLCFSRISTHRCALPCCLRGRRRSGETQKPAYHPPKILLTPFTFAA